MYSRTICVGSYQIRYTHLIDAVVRLHSERLCISLEFEAQPIQSQEGDSQLIDRLQ